MTVDIDELLEAASPRTTTVEVCVRGDLADRHEELARELKAVMEERKHFAQPSGRELELAEQIVAVEREQQAATVTITLKALGRRAWADLLAKHPPTPEMRKRGLDHHELTFPPALIAASAVEPTITGKQANRLADVLPVGEWNKLWMAAVALNVGGVPHPKLQAASELLRASGRSSDTAAPEGSPDPSSSGGNGEPSSST